MKQKIISIILVLCICLPLTAQHRHEFSANIGGGLSTLNYKPTLGKFTGGYGGEAGLGYHYFFSPNWGIGTGVNFALYNSETTSDNVFFGRFNTTTSNTFAGRAIEFAYSFGDYKEEISATMLTIPLMVQYQTGGKIGLFAAVGGKVGIPLSANNKLTTGTLTTSAYFPDWHVTYDDLPQYGFGTYDGLSKENDFKLKTAVMLSAELGAKFRFGNSMYLYVGGYLDYGLNDIRKQEGTGLAFAYTPGAASYPEGFAINGSLAEMSDKISPLAIGGKIRVSFGSKAFDEVREVAPPAPVEQPQVDEAALARERAAAEAARLEAEARAKAEAEARAAAEAAAREKAAQEALANADRNAMQAPIDGYTVSQVRLSKDQQNTLDEKIEILKRRPDWTVHIDGHTCEIGGNVVNERVGLARAEAAKKYMIEKGIDASRIVSVASKRDTQPVVSNTNEANRKINRRVTLVCEICK